MKYPYSTLLLVAQREVAMRVNLYPRLVEAKRIKPADAQREIEAMQDIAEILTRLDAGTKAAAPAPPQTEPAPASDPGVTKVKLPKRQKAAVA